MEGVDVLFINRNKQPNHVSKLDFCIPKKVKITVSPLTEHNCLLRYNTSLPKTVGFGVFW